MSFLGRRLIRRPWASSPSTNLLPSFNPHTISITITELTSNRHHLSTSSRCFTTASKTTSPTTTNSMSTSHPDPKTPPPSKILEITPLSPTASKWITLSQISYLDPSGRQRIWEVASRKTRSAVSGVDAVAIGTIILSPSRPPCTILVLQYRPPVDAITVEWPAGLVDEGETCEEAALRELREETGFGGDGAGAGAATVVDVSPVVASDPGMTAANMRLVMVQVELGEDDEEEEEEEEEEKDGNKGKGKGRRKKKELQLPAQHLDEGEFITRVVVPLDSLYYRLVEYSKREGFIVSAKLWHWAAGLHFAAQVAKRM